jgi:hypothetical protein
MLQAVYHLSVVYPLHYWSSIIILLLVACYGWFHVGTMRQVVVVSPAPTTASVRPRYVFHQQSHAILLLLANLIILGQAEAQNDLLVFTLAIKVT